MLKIYTFIDIRVNDFIIINQISFQNFLLKQKLSMNVGKQQGERKDGGKDEEEQNSKNFIYITLKEI